MLSNLEPKNKLDVLKIYKLVWNGRKPLLNGK